PPARRRTPPPRAGPTRSRPAAAAARRRRPAPAPGAARAPPSPPAPGRGAGGRRTAGVRPPPRARRGAGAGRCPPARRAPPRPRPWPRLLGAVEANELVFVCQLGASLHEEARPAGELAGADGHGRGRPAARATDLVVVE